MLYEVCHEVLKMQSVAVDIVTNLLISRSINSLCLTSLNSVHAETDYFMSEAN